MSESPTVSRPMIYRWLAAFTGFYRPSPGEIGTLDPVSAFLYSARSVILVISAQAALVSALLAASTAQFHWLESVLVLVGFVVAHMLSNLSNDFFGYRRGDDTPESPRMRYTLHPFAGDIPGRGALRGGLAVLAVTGVAIAVFFIVERGALGAACSLAGIFFLFAYDAAPVPLKSIGLGEIAVFLVWGPLMVGGGYAMITGRLSANAFYASVPCGLGVMSILIGKHIDQIEFDRGHGNHTLPVMIEERRSRLVEISAIVLMYAVVGTLIAAGRLTPFAAVVLLALPRARRALGTLLQPRPESAPPGYVGWPLWYHRACLLHNRMFGWLYVVGLAIGVLWPAVRL